MTSIRTWYTYATDVLGYKDPIYKLILGVTRESTCEKLRKAGRFLICPKDTTRHTIKNFKSLYHTLYHKKNTIVLPNNMFKIQLCGKIVDSFTVNVENQVDIDFIKALGSFIPWTFKHIMEYTSGKKVYQEGMKFGTISICVLRIFKLSEDFTYYRESKPRVANQFFNIERGDEILYNCTPILSDETFNELFNSIKYLHDFYSILKS